MHTLAKNTHGWFLVPDKVKEKPDIRHLLNNRVHEPNTIEFLVNNAGDGIIISAGTFIGDFLPPLGRIPNKVYAFEPVKEFYHYSQMNLMLNFFDGGHNIELANMGLGEGSYSKRILKEDANGKSLGGSSLYSYDDDNKSGAFAKRHKFNEDTSTSGYEDTQITSLDEYIPEEEHDKVSIIQLDVEGYEEKALMGARDIIAKSSPFIIIELWIDPQNPDRQLDALKTDFYQNEILGSGYEIIDKMYQNVILQRK